MNVQIGLWGLCMVRTDSTGSYVHLFLICSWFVNILRKYPRIITILAACFERRKLVSREYVNFFPILCMAYVNTNYLEKLTRERLYCAITTPTYEIYLSLSRNPIKLKASVWQKQWPMQAYYWQYYKNKLQ